MPNGSPISLSVLLVGISRNVRTASVTCGDTRTLKFTLIVQRMPMSGRPRGQPARLRRFRSRFCREDLEGAAGAGAACHLGVVGQQRGVEQLGERDIRSVVGGVIVTQVP